MCAFAFYIILLFILFVDLMFAAFMKIGAANVTRFCYRVHVITISPVQLLEKFSEKLSAFWMRGCRGERNDLVKGCSITNSAAVLLVYTIRILDEAQKLISHSEKTAIFLDENAKSCCCKPVLRVPVATRFFAARWRHSVTTFLC